MGASKEDMATVGHVLAQQFQATVGWNFCGGDDNNIQEDVDSLTSIEFLLPFYLSIEVLHSYTGATCWCLIQLHPIAMTLLFVTTVRGICQRRVWAPTMTIPF